MIFRSLDKQFFEEWFVKFCKNHVLSPQTVIKIFGHKEYLPRNQDKKSRLIKEYEPMRLLGLTYSEIRELFWQWYSRSQILDGKWEIDKDGNQVFKPLIK